MIKTTLFFMAMMTVKVHAECVIPPTVAIGDAFQLNYRIDYTQPFTATIFPNQNDFDSVSVLVNGEEAQTIAKSTLVNIGGGYRYRLESSIGPEFSNANIIVPLNRNHITVRVNGHNDCDAVDEVALIGGDSGVRAVVIGINEYSRIENTLNYAVQDAKDFVAILKIGAKKAGRRLTYEFLTDEYATKNAIERAMEVAASKISSEGSLIIYFSGHGMVKAWGSRIRAFLVPYDGDQRLARSTMLSHTNALDILQDAPAKNKIFIFDSCFSGRGSFEDFTVQPDLHEKYLPLDRKTQIAMAHAGSITRTPDNVLWFSSSSGSKVSYELERYGHGLFTHFLLKSIEDVDFTEGRSRMRYSDIKDYIQEKIEAEHGDIQKPSTVGNDDILAVGLWSPEQ